MADDCYLCGFPIIRGGGNLVVDSQTNDVSYHFECVQRWGENPCQFCDIPKPHVCPHCEGCFVEIEKDGVKKERKGIKFVARGQLR